MDDRFQATHFPRGALHTNNVTVTTVQCTGYVLLAVTSIAMIVRYAALIRRFRDLKAEDYLLLVAYAFFVELTVLYIIISPVIFRLAALQAGLIKPYPSLPQDGLKLQIYYFVTTSSLWLCLWMVKFSLLSMYKRFLSGRTYVIAWWTIMIFCILVGLHATARPRPDQLPVSYRLHPFLVVLLFELPCLVHLWQVRYSTRPPCGRHQPVLLVCSGPDY